VDSARRILSSTLRKNVIAAKIRLDSLSEELRILYVAMTRAREKLILSGMVTDIEKVQQLSAAQGMVPFSNLAAAMSYLDFILPCMEKEKITFIQPEDLAVANVEETLRVNELQRLLLLSHGDNEIMTEVSQKFNRDYKYQYLSNLFIKTTVSELKKAGNGHLSDKSIEEIDKSTGGSDTENGFTRLLYELPEVVPYIPSFVKEKETMSGTDRGSAYHKVMELLDFGRLSGLFEEGRGMDDEALSEELGYQLSEMERKEKLSGEWRQAVSLTKLMAFLHSDLAGRMMKAGKNRKLYREQPFVMGLPASRLSDTFPETEMVLVQGIIDVFFEEEDHIVVADYKTDKVSTAEELLDRYRVQLDYYAQALERLTGKPVAEKIIYSFALHQEIPIDKTQP
jgi:ATP-dependent helicase/nuclease subunit A